jgi:thymidylate synthase (FAD)
MTREELLAKYSEPIPVLDHGFIQLIDVMGDDAAVLQAARTSTNAESKGPHADRRLLRYLFKHRHATPFEAANIKVLVRLPIFVERQWVRHRASWLNEVSARYTTLPEEYYIPETERVQRQSRRNKQGSADPLPVDQANHIRSNMDAVSRDAFKHYGWVNEQGVAKELARINLPVSTYTQKVWGTSLRMLLHFLGLRQDPHAQWEIRQYANVLADILEDWTPWTAEAFLDYQLEAKTFSRMEMLILREMVEDFDAEYIEYIKNRADEEGMTPREKREFLTALRLA